MSFFLISFLHPEDRSRALSLRIVLHFFRPESSVLFLIVACTLHLIAFAHFIVILSFCIRPKGRFLSIMVLVLVLCGYPVSIVFHFTCYSF